MSRTSAGGFLTRVIVALIAVACLTIAMKLLMEFFDRIEAKSVMVRMRDGVKLYTKIWKPAQGGRYPVVLTRGYAPGRPKDAHRFNKAGYVYIGQSTRGPGRSGIGNSNAMFGQCSTQERHTNQPNE